MIPQEVDKLCTLELNELSENFKQKTLSSPLPMPHSYFRNTRLSLVWGNGPSSERPPLSGHTRPSALRKADRPWCYSCITHSAAPGGRALCVLWVPGRGEHGENGWSDSSGSGVLSLPLFTHQCSELMKFLKDITIRGERKRGGKRF